MDPASVVGLVGAVLGIADVVAKSVRTLLDMQSKFMTADVRVSTLIGQLSTLKAALGHIADMMSEEMSAAQYGQFFSDLDTALQGCEAMITALDTRLSALERNVDRLSISAKVQTIWDDSTLNEYLGILNNQIQALNLLLTALQCRSMMEQNNLLREGSTRKVFKQVRDDTSSLLWLRDADSLASYRTASTQDMTTVDVEFAFDREVCSSKVYRSAIRSNMMVAIQTGRNMFKSGRPGSRLRMSRNFSIHSEKLLEETESSSSSILTAKPTVAPQAAASGVVGIRDVQPDIMHSITDSETRKRARAVAQLEIPPKQAPGNSINIMVSGIYESGRTTLIKSFAAALDLYDLDARAGFRSIIKANMADMILNLMPELDKNYSFTKYHFGSENVTCIDSGLRDGALERARDQTIHNSMQFVYNGSAE
jgi:hypothetical protein